MAQQVQFRRGTTSEHGSFTGAVGEVTVDTDKDTLIVHDNSQAGGFAVANLDGTRVYGYPELQCDDTYRRFHNRVGYFC